MPDTDTDEHTVQTRYERVWNALIKAETARRTCGFGGEAMFEKYPKIQSVWKRDEKTGAFLDEYSTPEIGYLADNDWLWQEKVDGENVRIGWDGRGVRFGGKSDKTKLRAHLLEWLEGYFTPDRLRDVFNETEDEEHDVTLYGEGHGEKIQKDGKLYMPDGRGVSLILFDVKIGMWWLRPQDVLDIAFQLGVRTVETYGVGPISSAVEIVRHGMKSKLGDRQAEGMVLRPFVPLRDRAGHRIITKLKTKDFAR